MKTVARGLENKIIELQQKLDEKVCLHILHCICCSHISYWTTTCT